MKKTFTDYEKLTEIAKGLNMIPYANRSGEVQAGLYTLNPYNAPIDLSACAENEISILKTAVFQLSEKLDEAYQQNIERDLAD